MQPGGNSGPYQVHLSGAVAEEIRQMQREASLQGRGEEVVSAFRRIVSRLRQNSSGLGEPLYNLPAMRMQVRFGIVGPLAIHYGVCEDRPLVFIRGIRLL